MEEEKPCSFHEMELDDRILKVKLRNYLKVDENLHKNSFK